MRKEPEKVEMDLQKIFLTPPNTMREKITLVIMMVVVFVMFFGPVTFTEISPVKGIILSAFPALSISWGWMVLLRSQMCIRDRYRACRRFFLAVASSQESHRRAAI